MNRPYIISHMMMSVDGRIDCPMVSQISGEEYYYVLEQFGTSSKLSGRLTAALECSAVGTSENRKSDVTEQAADSYVLAERHLNAETSILNTESITGNVNGPQQASPFPATLSIGHETFNIACKSDEYTIVTDTHGRLNWISAKADGHPLLCLMSEQVSDKHLEAMRELGISYIVTGKDHIDLQRAMELVHSEFGIEKIVVVGGGHINGGFLEAGLLDEVSVMVAAGIDGRNGETAVFDGAHWHEGKPYHLSLKDVRRWKGTQTIWIRYEVVK